MPAIGPYTKIKVNFMLKRSHWEELQELAKYEDRSASSILRQIISEYLRDQSEAREAAQEREVKKPRQKRLKRG